MPQVIRLIKMQLKNAAWSSLLGLGCAWLILMGCDPAVAQVRPPRPPLQDALSAASDDVSEKEVRAELVAFLDRFMEATREPGLGIAIDDFYDVDQMIVSVLDGVELDDRASLRLSMNFQLRQRLRAMVALGALSYQRAEIVKASLYNRQRSAVVMSRGWDADGLSHRQRFWLRKRDDGQWRIVDFEEPSFGVRSTSIMSALMAELMSGQRTREELQRVRILVAAFQSALSEDFYAVREQLASLESQALPESLEPFRWIMKAGIALQDFAPDECLRCLANVEKYRDDIPLVHSLRATAYNQLGRYQQALEEARKFTDIFGRDAETQLEIGVALEGLGRREEALQAFRAGLEDTPDFLENLVQLGLLLPADQKAELATRLGQLAAPQERFDLIAGEFEFAEDYPALKAVLEGLRRIDPRDPNLAYYGAVIRLRSDEDPHAAMELLDTVLGFGGLDFGGLDLDGLDRERIAGEAFNRVPEDELVFYEDLYLDSAFAAEQELQAYEQLDDKRRAFAYLSPALIDSKAFARFASLVELHQQNEPHDLELAHQQALAKFEQADFAAADEFFKQVSENPEAPDSESIDLGDVMFQRIDCWYRMGKSIEALDEFQPRHETYNQLAGSCLQDDRHDHLETLTEAYLQEQAPDHHALYWQVTAASQLQDHATVIDGAKQYFQRLEQDASIEDWRLGTIEGLAIAAHCARGEFDEARRIALMSTERDGDPYFEAVVYAHQGKTEELQAVLKRLLQETGYEADWFLDNEDFDPAFAKHPELKSVQEWLRQQVAGGSIN